MQMQPFSYFQLHFKKDYYMHFNTLYSISGFTMGNFNSEVSTIFLSV
jgi:hypothetical protein